MNNGILETLRLTSTDLDNIAQRLSDLTNTTSNELAYEGVCNLGPRCGCKGSCDGGCTSW